MPISGKLKFFTKNLIDESGVVLSSNVTNQLPLSNLQHTNKRKVWRGSGTSAQITIDLGAAQAVDSLLLTRENFTAAGTIEWRYSSDNFTMENVSAGVLTVGTKPKGYDLVFPLLLDGAITRRYWRVILNDSTNPDGFLSIGRVYLGVRTEFSAGLAYPLKIAMVDRSHVRRSAGGDPLRHRRARWRQVSFDISAMDDETEAHQAFWDFCMEVGLSTDFFLSLSPGSAEAIQRRHTLYGSFTQIDGLVEEGVGIYTPRQIVFEES